MAGFQVVSDTASTSSPLRTVISGAGCWVAARTVVYEVRRKDCSLSENTTKADPTDGCPASSSVDTNHTDGAAASSSPLSVSPLAAKRWSSSSWPCTAPTAVSRSVSIRSTASSTAPSNRAANSSTRSSVWPRR